MKKTLIHIILLFLGLLSFGQAPFGNEWINYNQQYFTIKVYEQGLYRISYGALLDAGVPLGSFDPRSFQLFFRGQEQPIVVANEQSGLFQPGDYILFYGDRNDGQLDEELYKGSQFHPNPNYSLYTDTATYYLTWNSLLNNRRFVLETDINFEGYTPAPYFWHTERQDYTGTYYAGETNNVGITDPEYTQAQGWFDAALTLGQSRSKTIPTPNLYLAGPQARIDMAVAGASNYATLSPDHHLQIQFASQLIDTLYDGYKLLKFTRNVNVSSLNPAGTPFVFTSINNLNSPVDRSAIIYIQVRYPHSWNLRNLPQLKLELPAGNESKTLINFSSFDATENDTVWVFDLGNNRQIPVLLEGEQWKALVPDGTQLRSLFLTSSARIKAVDQVQPVSTNPSQFARFRNFGSPPYLEADYLLITHHSLWDAATQYMNYRNSTGQQVLMAEVDELMHQYAYGTFKHPLALRNFVRFVMDRNPEALPEYLFLVGKGIDARSARKNASVYAANLVPSFGDRSSDALITAGLDGYQYAPALATGRLSARNPAHVNLYLNKVIEYEAAQQEPQDWMKNILHFGGGSSQIEQVFLYNYLRQYKEKLEAPYFGGYVRTFLKSSTEPIQINQSDSLKQIINNGVSLMTFFGHATGVGFDISIDQPSEYDNAGRYPFVTANSCYSGDLFGNYLSTSEDFVLLENKGAIGYMGATTLAGTGDLHQFSNRFFGNLSYDMYGQSIGKNIRKTIRDLQAPIYSLKYISLYSALHADPALIINSFPQPDYRLTQPDISFIPKDVTAELDTFTVRLRATNIGKAITDSMMVELVHTLPDGSTKNYLKRVTTPLFRSDVDFRLPIDRVNGIGLNYFTATLDAYNEIEELNESNNLATTSLLIKSADLQPVYPPKYAVVPEPQVTLKASVGNPFGEARNYTFELDTNARFLNPLRENINSGTGVITWSPPLSMTDSTVYFWRVSQDSTYTGEYNWRNSSFQYISGQRGWSQAHFDQFGLNNYRYVNYNETERLWDFENNRITVAAQTGYYPYMEYFENWLRVNGVLTRVWSCLSTSGHGMVFFVFDPVSGENWLSIPQGDGLGQFGNNHCTVSSRTGFDFYTHTDEWRERVRIFLDSIPDDHYIMAWSHRNHYAENFSEELKQSFEAFGSGLIRNLPNNLPYLIWGQKGQAIGSANEAIGQTITSIIQIEDSLETNWNRGFILSEPIGPASSWESIHWRQNSLEEPNTDEVSLDVFAMQPGGEPVLLYEDLSPSQTDIHNLGDSIDASQYPLLQLRVNMFDNINRTPAQMDRWQVLHEGIPEAALDPGKHFVFQADTLQEGQDLIFSTAITNISNYDMDSLLVRYWIVDENRQTHPIAYPRQAPLLAGQSLIDTVQFSTRGLLGNNTFWIEVNPDNDQLEQYLFNNIGSLPFYVERDKANPLLDVTFDGIRILDGEVVSPKPHVRITLNDENQFLLLNDTSLLKVFLQTPLQPESQRVYFTEGGQEIMRFFPASLPDNTCVIEYDPEFLEDGTYHLRIQASDKSLNESGDEDYTVSFEVINRSTITEVLNWPNPFSTATHFVFTLTGSELPTFFRIQILTITGKVVREIDMEELGPLRIGRNITQYAWDGTDEYGDRLANGVYLYRIITNINGEEIERNPTAASRFFHREMGKMYLIR
ncbi:MAG: C25 family cysteine peptidase [Bacteroides sp.]|nr:C25 family cysteine peptidase [Bacteroides sp.]